MIENHLEENPLSGQFFVAFSGNEPWFPPFRGGGSGYISIDVKGFSSRQKKKLEQAENHEFLQKNYLEAISLLEELLKVTEDRNLQAQLLNRIARNHRKQKNYEKAIANYTNIIQNFPDTRTSSGSLLPVTVRLQLVECYLRSGLGEEALNETLKSFREIIRNSSNLSEDQLSAYVSLAGEKFISIRDAYPEMISSDTTYVNDFEDLNLICQKKINEWNVIRTLKNECISDILEDFTQNGGYAKNAHRYSKKISSEDFLIISSQIPDEPENLSQGITGIKICNTFLEDTILTGIIRNTGWNADDSLTVTDMSGRIILGYKATSPNENRITSLFDDNFPPWRIEVSGNLTRPFLFTGIFKSYYFWTILAMMA
ncbi:MAG: tetratricopeptide repeat protein, partial [Bacteroidales bacterium]|nr:tetratricopeptide repeat protein [Bacteroidales bacterium]